jgi:uncharacterized membrane protein YphA (DoxX/SURF4 family)
MNGSFARTIYGLCRIALGAIFIYAAVVKISAPQSLADRIASYQLVPYPVISPIALGLPLFELACGLSLLTGYFCTTALLSVVTLLFLFLAALISALARGLPIDCGCFGVHSWLDAKPWLALGRDGVLLLGAIYAYKYGAGQKVSARSDGKKRAERRSFDQKSTRNSTEWMAPSGASTLEKSAKPVT